MNRPAFVQVTASVLCNRRIARDTFQLRLRCPDVAERIRPGQFVMLRLPDRIDPLIGRAFALYDTAAGDDWPHKAIDLVYLVVGKMTRAMARLRDGDRVVLWGPLGNGFPSYDGTDHLVLVAGGIGQTPFPALIRRVLGRVGYGSDVAQVEVKKVSIYYGVRSSEYLAGIDTFEEAGAVVHIATEDGSAGFRGRVTDLVASHVRQGEIEPTSRWVGCGPEPMLEALARLAAETGHACDVSLETPMACGTGLCFSCVVPVGTGPQWDYRRVCVDGPVFDSSAVCWTEF